MMHHSIHSIHYRLLENVFLFLFTGMGFCLVEVVLFLWKRKSDK